MKIYFYTENFALNINAFDVFVFDSDSEQLNLIPRGSESQSRLQWLSKHEAPNEINKAGISTSGASGAKAYLSFKILTDQCAPKSGRARLIFGSTDEVWFTGTLEKSINAMLKGIHELLKECSLTIPPERMQCIKKELESTYLRLNKKVPFVKKTIGLVLITAGVIMLAKSNQTDMLPNGEKMKTT